ncbi:hypothetical protein M3Y96_00576600 [Aphelenchoides besseyi]|nr:hypothetical protein M3Y96_00576600 [Aphelenchoides besseyi]
MRRSDGSTWNSHTITDHRNYFRELCVNWQLKQDVQIGGPGHTVQIDETCISRRKYNRGRLQKENVWLFGGVDTVDRTFFLKRVDCRSADTLLPIIQKHVKAGSTIMSDQWRAYGGICRLPEGYTHLKVNHSVHFVNPETGTHTQQIESFWRDVKQRQKRELGTATQFYDDDYVADSRLWQSDWLLDRLLFFVFFDIRVDFHLLFLLILFLPTTTQPRYNDYNNGNNYQTHNSRAETTVTCSSSQLLHNGRPNPRRPFLFFIDFGYFNRAILKTWFNNQVNQKLTILKLSTFLTFDSILIVVFAFPSLTAFKSLFIGVKPSLDYAIADGNRPARNNYFKRVVTTHSNLSPPFFTSKVAVISPDLLSTSTNDDSQAPVNVLNPQTI